jgi:hypothetical protein
LVTDIPSALIGNSYYIGIRHRNSITTWSANPIPITAITSYNFSDNQTKAYGNNLSLVEPGIWALFSGDFNQDATMDAFDYIELDADLITGNTGYLSTDLDGDGTVDLFDYLLFDPNLIQGISAILP